MSKRILVIFCLMAILMGIALVPTDASAETESYQVGYSIKDMNPWVDPADHSKGVLPVRLTGNGNDTERECTGMMDDNDDGEVGDGDGLHTTCTVITDPYGNTIMYITIDSLQGYAVITNDVRKAIVNAIGFNNITAKQILVNGSHSHSSTYFPTHKTTNNSNFFKSYYQYVIDQITSAAVEAYNDRAPAEMTKGTIDAQESTAYLGYNGGKGYYMNAIRHYNMEISNGSDKKQYVAGSNFGAGAAKLNASRTFGGLKGYKVTDNDNLVESDNDMHVLQFTFDNGNEPILLVNWRAHTTNNSGGTNKTLISSDYVNSLRANLKEKGYRAAFLQGAAGNVVMHSATRTDWSAEDGGVKDSNTYGRILADIAVDCVKRKMSEPLHVGQIRTFQHTYQGQVQVDSEGLRAAVDAFDAEAERLQAEKNDDTVFPSLPYVYEHTDGKEYIINSKFHASVIKSRENNLNNSDYTQLELNAIMLGDNVAFVTAPNEIVDRYDLGGSRSDTDNDWLELNDSTYGTPFVLGYTNDGKGYIPNSLDYTYNTDEYYEITGWGADGDNYFGAGSYEANTSRFERGTGEAIVQHYKWMLKMVQDVHYTAMCEVCDQMVTWKPIAAADASVSKLKTGHYYLVQDLPAGSYGLNQKTVDSGDVLCLDLNGHKSEVQGRTFIVKSGGTLNIFDRKGTGKIISYSGGNNVAGGLASVSGTMNIYGGTLQFVRQDLPEGKHATGCGGVISCTGTVNMYGGTLMGSELEMSTYTSDSGNLLTYNGCGATVHLGNGGMLNASGGHIVSGKAANGGKGDCVYLSTTTSKVTLSGDAVVDEIFVNTRGSESVSVGGIYTGRTNIRFDTDVTYSNKTFGKALAADLSGCKITCVNNSSYSVTVSDGNLTMTAPGSSMAATVYGANGAQYYTSVNDALNNYSCGYIKLIKDATGTVPINKTAYIDLNGFDLPAVTVKDGCILYAMDSCTDDYTVEDAQGYGVIGSCTGNVQAVSNEWNLVDDGYAKMVEDGKTSFHRVNLQIYAMTLRPDEAGLYYNSAFVGDEVVAQNVIEFGIALSVMGVPDAGNINDIAQCSKFENFKAGVGANADSSTGTLLKGVMKLGNNRHINERNADLPVYGRAYIRTEQGYIFGKYEVRSFREEVEGVNKMWDELTQIQKDKVVKLYETFAITMRKWNIPAIIANSNIGTNITDIPFDSLI